MKIIGSPLSVERITEISDDIANDNIDTSIKFILPCPQKADRDGYAVHCKENQCGHNRLSFFLKSSYLTETVGFRAMRILYL